MSAKLINSFQVNEQEIHVVQVNGKDYISLTDIAKGFENSRMIISNWLQNKNTIDFLAVWEKINNDNFNYLEFQVVNECWGEFV